MEERSIMKKIYEQLHNKVRFSVFCSDHAMLYEVNAHDTICCLISLNPVIRQQFIIETHRTMRQGCSRAMKDHLDSLPYE